ncbi:hypothetical protein JCM31598_27720 [Desulfonatronum parangueonense]
MDIGTASAEWIATVQQIDAVAALGIGIGYGIGIEIGSRATGACHNCSDPNCLRKSVS